MADDPKIPAAKPAAAKKPVAAKAPVAKAAAAKATAAKKPAAAKAPAAKAAAPTKPADAEKAPLAKAAAAAEVAEVTKPVAKKPAAKKPAAAAPAKPAPTRKARPVGPVTVQAHARYVRSSARKARLVCNHIRGKSVPEARALLGFAPRGVAADWAKLLDSAVANAEHNHELVGDELRVKAVFADEGPTLKRFRPRAMGRATPIHKRTSHLTIMLGPKE
jgi:ribosomal protein L22